MVGGGAQATNTMSAIGIPAKMHALLMPQEDPDFPLFAENASPVALFCAMETQMQYVGGLNGIIPTGLNYVALPAVEARLGITPEESADHFQCLRLMEGEWLLAQAERRKLQQGAN